MTWFGKGKFKKGNIPWNKGKVKEQRKRTRVMFIPDPHIDKHLPFDPLYKFAADFQPHTIVFGGDMFDFGYLSHWNSANFENIGHDNIAKQIERDAEIVRDIIAKFKAIHSVDEIVFIIGNHEIWFYKYQEKYQKRIKQTFSDLLHAEELGVKIVEFGQVYQKGKLRIRHGECYGTDNPAKQAIMRSHHSILFGHCHTLKVWTAFSDMDKNSFIAVASSCWAKIPMFKYLDSRPNSYSNGFAIAWVKSNGNFQLLPISASPAGSFIYNNKEYEA